MGCWCRFGEIGTKSGVSSHDTWTVELEHQLPKFVDPKCNWCLWCQLVQVRSPKKVREAENDVFFVLASGIRFGKMLASGTQGSHWEAHLKECFRVLSRHIVLALKASLLLPSLKARLQSPEWRRQPRQALEVQELVADLKRNLGSQTGWYSACILKLTNKPPFEKIPEMHVISKIMTFNC